MRSSISNAPKTALFAALIMAVCAVAWAQSQPSAVPSTDYQIINDLVNRRMSLDERRMVEWRNYSGTNNGEVFVKGVFDSQGLPCASLAQCSSPCRAYEFTFRGTASDGALVDYAWEGERCLRGGGWVDISGLRQTRSIVHRAAAPAAPPVRVTAVTRIQQNLAALRYYSGSATGEFTDSTSRAVREFLADERVNQISASPSDDELVRVGTLTQRARDRVRRASSCGGEETYRACGRRE